MHPGYDFFNLFLLATMVIGAFVWLLDPNGQVGEFAGFTSLCAFALMFLGARH